jgi:class 3 adenylate cyclase/CheY-like chemotaxis protein
MKEQIVNILIIDDNESDKDYLYNILQSPGNNIFTSKCKDTSIEIIKKKKIAIVLCSVDTKDINFFKFIDTITTNKENKDIFVIATASKKEKVYKLVKGLKKGAVDYLLKPYTPNLVKAKIDTYKRIYLKNKRISNLLENILPLDTLNEFEQYGKSTPKKHKNCTILFTDFVKFSQKARQLTPKELIEKLDYYFTKFDEIILKYKLEKIKTIGDAYMAVGGVTKKHNIIEINTALAALEIQNFINTEIQTQKALGNDYWEIRIGLHSGDLIAGVIGKHKFSFDVWGDSVNVAARCEQTSIPNHINISEDFFKKINPFFETTLRGCIKVKNRGEIKMHFLNRIKPDFSFDKRGLNANYKLRTLANLPTEDFDRIRIDIINQLKIELDDNLFYHSIEHTLNVEQAAKKYANLEGLSPKETMLVCTAALFHDAGFILEYDDNEKIGVKIFKQMAPKYGYSPTDIELISKMILATNNKLEPITLAEKILSDADHDYLGRSDYHHIAKKLRKELSVFKEKISDEEWLKMQIYYLETKHQYYTTSAINLRQVGKLKRITELKEKLKTLIKH